MKRIWMLALCMLMLMNAALAAVPQDEAIARAQEALWSALGDASIPLGDTQMYGVRCVYSERQDGYRIWFEPKVLDYGLCVVWVDAQETRIERVDEPGFTGDTVFKRFQAVYGSPADWDQAVWLELDAAFDGLEVTAFDAVLMKNTAYADAASAAITRDAAFEIALADYGQPDARMHTGVLIAAADGPIWKLRVMGNPACRLYEIDGMTGAILDREEYKADNYDFDNPVKMYTLRRDYEPALVERDGMEYVAAVAVSKAYGDMRLDNPMLGLHEEEGEYEVVIADGRVEFCAQLEKLDSYFVTFDENSMITEVGKL